MNRNELRADFETYIQKNINIKELVSNFSKSINLKQSEISYLKRLKIMFLILNEKK